MSTEFKVEKTVQAPLKKKSDLNNDFVTYQCWVRKEEKIKNETICKLTNKFEVLWAKYNQVGILVYFFILYLLKKSFASTRQILIVW